MAPDKTDEDHERAEELTRRRFVQVCVGVATAAAVGATVSSFLGVRSPLDIPALPEAREAVAVCPVCSIGCGVRSVMASNEPYPSKGDPQSSSTSGMVCTRGSLLPATAWPSTLGTPLRRLNPTTKGTMPTMSQFETVPWEEAIEQLTSTLVSIGIEFGDDARGCIMSADVAMEDAYVAGKLWKAVMNSSNIDTVESIHSRASEESYMVHLGQVAPPTCYDDVNLADMIVVVGEDIATTHPVLYARVVEAVADRGVELVVIDPRMSPTALRTRSVHVPVRAGGEVALLNSIGHSLTHTLNVAPSQWSLDNAQNAEAFAEYLKLYDPVYDENERVDADHLVDLCNGPSEWVLQLGNRDSSGYLKSFDVPTLTGLDPLAIQDLAKRWSLARNVLTIWSSRLASAGDDAAAVASVINLHLMTGHMGRPGAGPMGLHTHALGRGGFDLGGTPLMLPGAVRGGMGTSTPALEETWGEEFAANAARLPTSKGAIEMLGKAKQGDMPILFLIGGSVSTQLPDLENLVYPALRATFVVSTAAHLEDPDVAYADMVLPRPSWYERESYFISSERQVSRSLPSLAALEGTRPEWFVLSLIGPGMVSAPLFEFNSSTQVVEEVRRATVDAPADMRALLLGDPLTDSRGVQWPVVTDRSAEQGGTARRYMGQDGLGPGFPTPSGKATIIPREDPTMRRSSSPEYPMTAVMSLDAATWWDGQLYLSRSGDVVRPRDVEPAYIELTKEDAALLLLTEGANALVTSIQGSMTLPVRFAQAGTALGHVFIPWGADARTQVLSPSFPMDENGVPPWSAFPVRVEMAPEPLE